MDIKIIADSCCDLTDEMKKEMKIKIVPLTLRLGDKEYVDNESLNIKEYVQAMGECKKSPVTACPSPGDFIKEYKGKESVFVVTLSSKLSGTYQSAITAKNMFLEGAEDKFIHVFDSLSGSIGETLVCRKIHELVKNEIDKTEIVKKVSDYIGDMKTLFLFEDLDHLVKAGRLNSIVAKIASVLEIKPIMGSNGQGSIKLVEKIRGYKRAFLRLVDLIGEQEVKLEDRVLGIAYCNCLERALKFKEEVSKRYKFKDIIIVEMAGLSSTYADNGGIVIAF